MEHVAVYKDGAATVVLAECGITLSDLSPTQMVQNLPNHAHLSKLHNFFDDRQVEYTYDAKGPWLVSRCSLDGKIQQ